MSAQDAWATALSNAIASLRSGIPVVLLQVPGHPNRTVTAKDLSDLRNELMQVERGRFNRELRGP